MNNPQDPFSGIRHVRTFKEVAIFLVDVAEKEINFGHKPAFLIWKGKAGDFKQQFLSEFKAYARHQYPFNLPVDESKGALRWWKSLLGSDSAIILPVSCLTISLLSLPAFLNHLCSSASGHKTLLRSS